MRLNLRARLPIPDGVQHRIVFPPDGATVHGVVQVRGFTSAPLAAPVRILDLDGREASSGRVDHLPGAGGDERLEFVAFVNVCGLADGPAVLQAPFDSPDVSLSVLNSDVEKRVLSDAVTSERPADASERLRGVLSSVPGTFSAGPVSFAEGLEPEVDLAVLDSGFDPRVLQLMDEACIGESMALDLGAGRRGFYKPGIVQLDVVRHPYIDVVSDSCELPFRDEVFGMVYCAAVTEHVAEPWVLTKEIRRVLRPGGVVIVDAAFMSPFHAYPDHYFNMTDSGLRSLFPDVDVRHLGPLEHQSVWHSLAWQLNLLAEGLAPEERQMLAGLSLQELLAELDAACNGRASALDSIQLSPTIARALSAGFTLVGCKATGERAE